MQDRDFKINIEKQEIIMALDPLQIVAGSSRCSTQQYVTERRH
jgi:hypothetical protein